jgi:SPP1 family predicted phage head-tail adaptor
MTDIATVWAKVEPLEGNEQLRAMQAGMTRPHRFTIRWRAGITGATEVLYDGRRFNVTSVIDVEAQHREIVILADEAVV